MIRSPLRPDNAAAPKALAPLRMHRDGTAPWFRARDPLGISSEIRVAWVAPGTGNIQWELLSHKEVDGLGAIARLARCHGIRILEQPQAVAQPIPSFSRLAWSRWRGQTPATPVPFSRWATPANGGSNEVSVGWFSVAETLALKQAARQRGVPLSALLLAALHDMVMTRLAAPGSTAGAWLFPVSLRGSVALTDPEANHLSGFYLPLPAAADAATVQQAVRARLRAGDHWWLWHQGRWASLLPQACINLLYRALLGRSSYLGSFSYLGEWWLDYRDSDLPARTLLALCGPGSPNHPVANGILICNGALTLSLRLDPALGCDDRAREACLGAWQDNLLALLPASARGPGGEQRRQLAPDTLLETRL
ncbi:hypothetical protein [Isoalcanivorax indicus]|uniref:hypothetical protein n=1 Tax=Isoalcanivorax indicus TaxID=2202653 RepID=UPI000DB9DD02|nr:hypothetical protein [Isoalcanivorax indicus]